MIATQTILCPICRAPNRSDARYCQQCGKDVILDNGRGDYRLVQVVKEGGMGTIYRAVDPRNHEYAIKEMHDHFATAPEREDGIERFREEARLLQKLHHPAVPQVYPAFIDEGRYYMPMEFIHGEDLEDRLKREKRIDEPTVLRWAGQLCDVLAYMHHEGLIYRDMKPANIMISRNGNVKLIDFGIAKLLRSGERNTMHGTPGYSPPEQYQGLASPRSDIYALAATLHHLLTGRDPRNFPPFTFPPASSLNRQVSRRTSHALEQALSMDEAHRFATIEAFRRALPIPAEQRPPVPVPGPQPATRTFDPRRQSPSGERDVVPRQPRPEVVEPVAPRRPRTEVVPPVAPRTRPPTTPRSGGFVRTVRRAVQAVAIATILTGVGAAVRPDIVVPAIERVVQTVEHIMSPPTGGNLGSPISHS